MARINPAAKKAAEARAKRAEIGRKQKELADAIAHEKNTIKRLSGKLGTARKEPKRGATEELKAAKSRLLELYGRRGALEGPIISKPKLTKSQALDILRKSQKKK